MANHKSAIKRHRQSLKRRDRNRTVRTEVKSAIKHVRALADSGDKTAALEALRKAESLIGKAATKGLFHKKNAARKVSRLAKRISKKTAKA